MVKMAAVTKLVWLFATTILFCSVHVQCKQPVLERVREKDLMKQVEQDPCPPETPGKPAGCKEGTVGVLKNGESQLRITSYLGYAMNCGNGNETCKCDDKSATYDEDKLCLRKDLKKDEECIHTKECVAGHVCLPGRSPNPYGIRLCQNFSVFLRPNCYIVAILLIFLSALKIVEI